MDFQFWFLLSLKYLFSKKEKENNCVNLCPIIYYSILIFLLSPHPLILAYMVHTHTCKQQKLIIITRHWLCFVISPVVFPSGSKRKKYSKHFWEGKIIKKASPFFFVYFGLQIITRKKKSLFSMCECAPFCSAAINFIFYLSFFFRVCNFFSFIP